MYMLQEYRVATSGGFKLQCITTATVLVTLYTTVEEFVNVNVRDKRLETSYFSVVL